jgi:hypothetical protein
VDLRDASLRSASLVGARLQRATLEKAHLESASLFGAHLEGASLAEARLEGASLHRTRLEGASLVGAHLEGASLGSKFSRMNSLMQRLSLRFGAHLEGASLIGAHLEGAVSDSVHFEGASLDGVHLEGASLHRAHLDGAGLDRASLWRSEWGALTADGVKSLQFDQLAWTLGDEQLYEGLRRTIETVVERAGRKVALERIRRLDCNAIVGEELAPCAPDSKSEPAAVGRWRKILETARVSNEAHARAVAEILRDLVCGGNSNAIHILRGVADNDTLRRAGREGASLVDDLLRRDGPCPVSNALTNEDRAKLWEIKTGVEEASPRIAPAPEAPPVPEKKAKR